MNKISNNEGSKALSLGYTIKELRLRRKMTQEKLAEKTGISQNYLAIIEMGAKIPSLRVLMKIADSLQTKVKDLISF